MERKMQRISHVLGRLLLEFQPYWTPENPTIRPKSLLLVFHWSCLLPGLSLQSPVGLAQNAFMAGTVYGINTPSHKEWAGSWSSTYCVFQNRFRCLPITHHPQKHPGVQYFRVSGQMVTSQSTWMGWAELCCHQCSVQTTAAFGSCRCSEASNLQPAQIT